MHLKSEHLIFFKTNAIRPKEKNSTWGILTPHFHQWTDHPEKNQQKNLRAKLLFIKWTKQTFIKHPIQHLLKTHAFISTWKSLWIGAYTKP
jgi:hypothetical protein